MKKTLDGKAIVYADTVFTTPNGKTAHGLVRFTRRYDVVAVIDHVFAGRDAGEVLDGRPNNIPVFKDVKEALTQLGLIGEEVTLVVGLAPDGGRLPAAVKKDIAEALALGLHVDSGLHDFLSTDKELMAIADEHGCRVRDIRKTPERDQLHFFTGKIDEVDCLTIAVLGTDSAIGKRTTAWIIVNALRQAGLAAEMIGTGQTAWMQGAAYSMIMDSCINDFVAGEIEHAVHEAWKNERPDVILIEGQGSLMNPAYPGGFEILAAGRPDFVILQHAPKRVEYDGFPGYRLHPLDEQIEAIRIVSGKEVKAITINHEGMAGEEIAGFCERIEAETGLPTVDVLEFGAERLVELIRANLK